MNHGPTNTLLFTKHHDLYKLLFDNKLFENTLYKGIWASSRDFGTCATTSFKCTYWPIQLDKHARIQRGDKGSGPPEQSQNIGFPSNIGLDPLKNHKDTKPAFTVGPSSARQRNAKKWRFADGQMMTHFKWYLDSLSLSLFLSLLSKKQNKTKTKQLIN